MQDGPRVIGVLLVVVLAGCGALAGGGPAPITVTPAEVPDAASPAEATGPAETDQSPARFNDPSARAASHAAVLANNSYSIVVTQQFEFSNRNRSGQWRLEGRFAEDGRFRVTVEQNGSVFGTSVPRRDFYWSNGTGVLEATETNRSGDPGVALVARHDIEPPWRALPIDPRFEAELTRVLSVTAITDIKRVRLAGQEYEAVRVTLTGRPERSRSPGVGRTNRMRNLTARLVIDERGLVRRMQLRYVSAAMGEPVSMYRSVRYEAIGRTTVEVPTWVRTARNESATSGG